MLVDATNTSWKRPLMKKISLKSQAHDEMIDITSEVRRAVDPDRPSGAVLVYCPHTTAGLTINEGTDPAVQIDILQALAEVVPWVNDYGHDEGNSAAHVKASMTGPSVMVPVIDGRLALGQWQRIFFCEFDGPRSRTVLVKYLAD